jgi:hypothetical protein
VIGKLIIPDSSGHREVAYDTEKLETMVEAETLFKAALDKGGAAFKIDTVNGDVRIKDWDPTAAEVVVLAPLQGG